MVVFGNFGCARKMRARAIILMGDKVKATMHAFCDEEDFNAQNLNDF